MKIEYSGPKPIISEHGITFKEGKEDKYTYLKHALQILKAISHEYNKDKIYSYFLEAKELSQDEMIEMVLHYHPDIKMTLNIEVNSYNKILKDEESAVLANVTLNEEEKNVYINNLKIMQPYKMQRMKNKLFYQHIIETIKEEIHEHKIKEISSPFNEKFWHILQTIQGELSSAKNSVSSSLKVNNDEIMTITLKIKNL